MTAEPVVVHVLDAEKRADDATIAELASRQHGVVSRSQLVEAGLTRGAIAHRLKCGRLHVVARGVYAVGHLAVTRRSRWMAAVLAGDVGAVLSHHAAAAMWGIRTPSGRIDVTAPRKLKHRCGIVFHERRLPADELTVVDGIAVTGVSRTLVDLAASIDDHQFERAFDKAEMFCLTDRISVAQIVDRGGVRRGSVAIARVLEREDRHLTRSELEDRFLGFLKTFALPRPKMNTRLDIRGRAFEVDCIWHAQGLIVELDGRAVHSTTGAFERDRDRDRALQAAGWRVVRITWRQLHLQPELVAADLRRLLPVSPPLRAT